ncbi:MAG: MarR family transcriptional regulator [Acinetobacter populi]|jgi:DNA-binding MarR family transcriptional regulator|uniref:MarR family winged helix-turn-helix transcriptional regulator n=1 Tax=Acinetobacter populi TaxID=1582270 RepID=UPI002356BA01|nr:MarR family transcriptional regulator [Acinetobacter populi]MCH4246508.1 MarR family transcriptional regulator [Acinetobacter populi]
MPTLLPFRSVLLKSSRIFVDKINVYLQTQDLNYSLWQVLATIDNLAPCSLTDIANALNISQPAISKRIVDLENKQLIDYLPANNRREKIVTLSPQGLKHYQTCKQQIDLIEAKYKQDIDPQALQHATEVLAQFLNNLQKVDSHE